MTKFFQDGDYLINVENINMIGKYEDDKIIISLNTQYLMTTYEHEQQRHARFEELKRMLCDA